MKKIPEDMEKHVDLAKKAPASKAVAQMALHCLELTLLGDNDTVDDIIALCDKADQKDLGTAAAVCISPYFTNLAFAQTAQKDIAVATVINFPSGKGTVEDTKKQVEDAITLDATEVDIVLDYESFLNGGEKQADALLDACREACGPRIKMKVILESAAFDNWEDLNAASVCALICGADFLKTSTGKNPLGGASLEAAAIMLDAIYDTRSAAGIKISGGVKTVQDCAQYIALAESIMGEGWVEPENFRFGASSVLDDLVKTLRADDDPKQKPQDLTL